MKGSSKPYYQEALCEMIASRIASRLGIDHVEYSVVWENEEPFRNLARESSAIQ